MPAPVFTEPTRQPLPLILIRGFGGLGVADEKRIAYQGFNDGTVYPQKRGENYIYEGLILRFLKSDWEYHDATNVVGYYSAAISDVRQEADLTVSGDDKPIADKLKRMKEAGFFSGDRVVVDSVMARQLLRTVKDPCRSLWVFRYYDLDDRAFATYGSALVRLIDLIRVLAEGPAGGCPKVNIIAHSMGGLIVREAIQRTYPAMAKSADEYINKVVTLGTPHGGIAFQVVQDWIVLKASEEIEHFNPESQKSETNDAGYRNLHTRFPLERLLTVVGTNYRSYGVFGASLANRLFSTAGEYGVNYNRSDGLVKQTLAQIPGAPRTFVHKCHGGFDSLVTSREAFEVATRFFFGNIRARLRLASAKVLRGKDFFGKSEFFFGLSIKPRRVDFDLFHQSTEAENCYGPFREDDLSDPAPTFGWAGDGRLIWEGYLDVRRILEDPSLTSKDMVLRLDLYIGERDLFGVGFSDNVIFRKQYYVRALLQPALRLFLHTSENFDDPSFTKEMAATDDGWEFDVGGTGFEGRIRIELDSVPEVGRPQPLTGAKGL